MLANKTKLVPLRSQCGRATGPFLSIIWLYAFQSSYPVNPFIFKKVPRFLYPPPPSPLFKMRVNESGKTVNGAPGTKSFLRHRAEYTMRSAFFLFSPSVLSPHFVSLLFLYFTLTHSFSLSFYMFSFFFFYFLTRFPFC